MQSPQVLIALQGVKVLREGTDDGVHGAQYNRTKANCFLSAEMETSCAGIAIKLFIDNFKYPIISKEYKIISSLLIISRFAPIILKLQHNFKICGTSTFEIYLAFSFNLDKLSSAFSISSSKSFNSITLSDKVFAASV